MRWQLLISISVISIGAVVLSILLAVYDARERVKVEVTSSMELAQRFARDVVRRRAADKSVDGLLSSIPTHLKYVRHARILITDANGELHQIAPDPKVEANSPRFERAPDWFTGLVGPSVGTREVRVVLGNNTLGTILIVGEPGDELAEVWEEVSRRAIIWLGITLIMLALLYIVLGRILNPLAGLASGMQELEDGHYGTRLSPQPLRELGVIADRFNTLAGALEKARAENRKLYRHMITLQEEERRQVANELHDEAGPCLFGITANASSIARLADKVPEPEAKAIKSRIEEVLTVSERLKTINRDLLRQLRPVELGRISLQQLVEGLLSGFERRHPEVTFDFNAGRLERSYGETTDLTIFRCVQESLTNAMRHGGAKYVVIELGEDDSGSNGHTTRRLRLLVHDDGEGFAPNTPVGLGLTAMQERVRSLDGSSHVQSSPQGGTTITVSIPLALAREPLTQQMPTNQSAL